MTTFWDRYTTLTVKNISDGSEWTTTSDEMTIFFQTKLFMSGESSESYGASIDNTVLADIGIFNLSDDTIQNMRHENTYTRTGGSIVTLSSGYRDHNGVIFTGVISSIVQQRVGADVATMLKCRESKATVQNVSVNKTYESGKTISELVTALAADAGVPIGRVDDASMRAGARTYAPTVSLDKIFTKLAEEAGFVYEFKHGALYFLDLSIQKRSLYDLTPSNGLLSMYLLRNPMFVNDSYDVTTVLIHDLEWMGAVKIGDYVCAVTTKPLHTSNGDEHSTRFSATVGSGGTFVFGGGSSGGSGFGGEY